MSPLNGENCKPRGEIRQSIYTEQRMWSVEHERDICLVVLSSLPWSISLDSTVPPIHFLMGQRWRKAGHGCTLRLPGSLPTGIFRKKSIPGSAEILSHGSPGPTGILPAGHRSTNIKGTCRYSVVKLCECLDI